MNEWVLTQNIENAALFQEFPNAVVLNAVGPRKMQMNAKERANDRKPVQAQKIAKGRKRQKSASAQ